MMRFKKLEDCAHEHKSDFSFFKSFDSNEKETHLFCPDCRCHWYKEKQWSHKEWDEYVNDV